VAAFSDFTLFLFLSFFFVILERAVRYPSNPLLPSYIIYTSSWIFWSFHTSYRVCLVPAVPYSPLRLNAGADSSWSWNSFSIPQRASARGVLHPT
jgi:1-acyl-sn-glycerol-3-phosphate acyltransferase